jgi:hypothetical protein
MQAISSLCWYSNTLGELIVLLCMKQQWREMEHILAQRYDSLRDIILIRVWIAVNGANLIINSAWKKSNRIFFL